MTRPLRAALLAPTCGAVLSCFGGAIPSGPVGPILPAPTLEEVTPETRRGYIRRAQVWRPIDTAALDIVAGPQIPGAFPFDAAVTCEFVNAGRMSGNTPKFMCRDGGEEYKVKYGDNNGEVFAEVAGTRLFWALGFGADAVYPVQITCRQCPIDPWRWRTAARLESRSYRYATIERKLEAETIETKKTAGWSWTELDLVDSTDGGAPLAHREALKLLAVLTQHGDSKPGQQRLVCLPDGVRRGAGGTRCEAPFLLVSDLGGTFGGAREFAGDKAKLTFAGWTAKGVFREAAGCVGDLDANMRGELQYPKIREAGRKFLAERLALLSDGQIRDLFVAARADARGDTVEENGVRRPVTVDDWAAAFKKKRQEIADRRCPE